MVHASGCSSPSRNIAKGSEADIGAGRFAAGIVFHAAAGIKNPDIHRHIEMHPSGADGPQSRPPFLEMGQLINRPFMAEMNDIMKAAAALGRKIGSIRVDQMQGHDKSQKAAQDPVFRIGRRQFHPAAAMEQQGMQNAAIDRRFSGIDRYLGSRRQVLKTSGNAEDGGQT